MRAVIRALVVAAALALTAAPAAAGGALDERGWMLQPFQHWMTASAVPTPGFVTVRLQRCPFPDWPACADAAAATVYLDPASIPARSMRATFLHELGHVFDRLEMTDADRRRFQRLMKARRPWIDGWGGGVEEVFADAYAACALRVSDGPRYYPHWRTHQRVCSLIRSAAD